MMDCDVTAAILPANEIEFPQVVLEVLECFHRLQSLQGTQGMWFLGAGRRHAKETGNHIFREFLSA